MSPSVTLTASATKPTRATAPISDDRRDGTSGWSRPTSRPADKRKEGTSSPATTRKMHGIASWIRTKASPSGHHHQQTVSPRHGPRGSAPRDVLARGGGNE